RVLPSFPTRRFPICAANVGVHVGVALLDVPLDRTGLAPQEHRPRRQLVVVVAVGRSREERGKRPASFRAVDTHADLHAVAHRDLDIFLLNHAVASFTVLPKYAPRRRRQAAVAVGRIPTQWGPCFLLMPLPPCRRSRIPPPPAAPQGRSSARSSPRPCASSRERTPRASPRSPALTTSRGRPRGSRNEAPPCRRTAARSRPGRPRRWRCSPRLFAARSFRLRAARAGRAE